MSTFPHPTYSQHVLQHAYFDSQREHFGDMLDAHEAHAIMLAECGVISNENAQAIFRAVDELRNRGASAFDYQPGVEDLFFRIEAQIIEVAGAEFGGNLQLARSRNDLGHALGRMAFRRHILALYADLLKLRQSVQDLARQHLDTLTPGYTHTQPAQPATFAHYLAGVLSFLQNDQRRLAAAYANMNLSPLGAAAFTGTGFAIDRQRVAELLGFDGVIASTQHSIGASDHLTDTAFAVQSLAIGLSRVSKDLLFLATQEANAIRIDDSFIQISSIMPQKRNPVVLEHLRARLSRALGAAQTVVVQCHSIPYGDTQDIEDEIMPPLLEAIGTMQECVTLYTAVFATLTLNKGHLRQRAAQGFTTATELADVLVREAKLPFRQAHKIVATMVQTAVANGITSDALTLPMLQEAAQQVIGNAVALTEKQFADALDPQRFVEKRNGLGGAAPEATEVLIRDLADQIEVDEKWLQNRTSLLSQTTMRRKGAIDKLK